MILEGLVTTLSADGAVNLAPMGPRVDFRVAADGALELDRFQLRPFRTARTYANLAAHPEGVLHVTDDVRLLAEAALGPVEPPPDYVPALRVRGAVLLDCCRWYEFRVVDRDESGERAVLTAQVVHCGRVRDFFGLNRAKHAVIEAAILATRTAILPPEEITDGLRRLAPLVDKTGGDAERAAFALLQEHVRRALGGTATSPPNPLP
jgi:hypothetical protein